MPLLQSLQFGYHSFEKANMLVIEDVNSLSSLSFDENCFMEVQKLTLLGMCEWN